MNEEEKEAIKLLENIKNNTWTTLYIMSKKSKDADILLNLIEKQQAEIEKKDKIINLMALDIYGMQIECNRYFKDTEEVKQYFERKIEQ